ncbi:MAG: DNA-binding beta-propeller fold protein YncE, partial [Granulosicoccus sp.]
MTFHRKVLQTASFVVAVSGSLAFHAVFAFEAFITNERSGDLISIDQEGKQIHSQAICKRPRGMVKGLGVHQLLIACSDDNKVIELNTQTRSIERTFNGLYGAMTLAIHRPTNRLFVTNEGEAHATVVDLISGNALAVLPTGLEPDGIAVSDDGTKIFVASENAGLVHVFDALTYKETAVIVTHLRPRR